MYHISIKESKENQSLGDYKATRSTSSPLTPEKLNIWFPQCRSFTWSACPYVKIKPSQTAMLYRSFGQKFWGSFSQLVRKLFYEHWGPSKVYHLRNKEKNYNCLKKHFFFFVCQLSIILKCLIFFRFVIQTHVSLCHSGNSTPEPDSHKGFFKCHPVCFPSGTASCKRACVMNRVVPAVVQ